VSVKGTETGRESESNSALARLNVPKVVKLAVLDSHAKAAYSAEKSMASGTSDGVNLTLADAVRLVLLHSEASAEGKGSSYLVGLNDTKIGTDEQLGKICSLAAPPLVSLTCLIATAGKAAGEAAPSVVTAEVAKADTRRGQAIDAIAATTSSGSGTVPPPLVAAPAPPRRRPRRQPRWCPRRSRPRRRCRVPPPGPGSRCPAPHRCRPRRPRRSRSALSAAGAGARLSTRRRRRA